MPTRVLASLLVLLVLLAACGSDGDDTPSDVATVDVPTIEEADPTAEATVPEAPEPPAQDAPVDPFLAGVSEEIGEALGYCAQGARDWCAFVGPQLTNDQLMEIEDLCGLGDDEACSAAANLLAVGWAAQFGDPETDEPAPAPTTEAPVEEPVDDDFGTAELLSSGFVIGSDYYAFGSTYEEIGPALEAAIGAPVGDTGPTPIDAGCPAAGTAYRIVDYPGLSLTILDESPYASGYAHVAAWTAFAELPSTITPYAVLGDAPGQPIVPGSSTVFDLEVQFGSEVEFFDDEFGPTYALEDSGGRFFGFLDGLADDDLVQSVLAGQGCGE
ncbi:hypothetical protein [Euzebya rosea]|uniref:hypothetical protein n=1 Tax=Euzebya rosea TaxID=2052804 RepID=UPI00196AD3A5|nr:hypothetical protein [Euzebya rosea]